MRTFIMMITAAIAAATAQAQDLNAARGQILDHAAHIQTLHRERELLQLQNEIAKLRKECLGQGFVCSVGGLREAPVVRAPAPAAAGVPAGTPAVELQLLGVVGGRARIAHHGGQAHEYREGAAVAGWKLESIELDRVHLSQERVRHTLYIVREAPDAAPGEPGEPQS